MKIIAEDGFMPVRATDGAAGYDVRANDEMVVPPGNRVLIPLGFSLDIGECGIAAILLPRSGLGHKHGIVLGNLVGLVDSDYQGQVFASVWNTSEAPFMVSRGDRIAQMMFIPVLHPELELVAEFEAETARGDGGFGHSGVK